MSLPHRTYLDRKGGKFTNSIAKIRDCYGGCKYKPTPKRYIPPSSGRVIANGREAAIKKAQGRYLTIALLLEDGFSISKAMAEVNVSSSTVVRAIHWKNDMVEQGLWEKIK